MSENSQTAPITEASAYLRKLARQNAQVYSMLPGCRAILLTGSAAEGVSDSYSDLDIIIYYDELPSEAALGAALAQNSGINQRIFGARTETDFGEQYAVRGVECQFAHTTIAAWEREIAAVLHDLDVKSPVQKALGGMEQAIPLYGENLIRQWQATISQYPDALRDAMVRQHLAFFPLWGLQERLESRDATIWVHQILVENSYNLLAMLAGLNRLYFSAFQFKRMEQFVARLTFVPVNFGNRVEALFHSDAASAARQMEGLVDEVLTLIEHHLPHIDTRPGRTRIGWRHPAWKAEDLAENTGRS